MSRAPHRAPHRRRRLGFRRATAVAAAALCLAVAPTAGAFDTGPHFDITRDALTAEGFNDNAIQGTETWEIRVGGKLWRLRAEEV